MAELQHVSHECVLTKPKIFQNGICNICYKDETVAFSCDPCNFDLCKTCSNLPKKVSHDFHPQHSLEFCQNDRKARYIICSGCGNMSSGSFYECKECEIYLDLGCALMENIFRSWDAKEMLHNNHAHLVKRCRPGPDARGSCLLCELPLSPSAICYGCVHCYLFFHERCLDLPIQIRHPVHPLHPLTRLDYVQTCGKGRNCDACGGTIFSVPFGCLQCDFKLHLRCADTLLRGLMDRSHEHRLFYANTLDNYRLGGGNSSCHICKEFCNRFFFYCVECGLRFHLKCLDIPESLLVKKSYHIHPLKCKAFLADEEDSLEYCGVCETMVHSGHHVYSCEECDFLGHIACILGKIHKEVVPFPLYLKDLYSYGECITQPTDQDDRKTNKLENKLMVNSVGHTHLLRPVDLNELDERGKCNLCDGNILSNACKCESCCFQAHDFCADLGRPLRHRFHLNHPLTLLPNSPVAGVRMNCDICKKEIAGFNLFCRVCSFVIHVHCVLQDNHFLGMLNRGQKLISKTKEGYCIPKNHRLFEVIVSMSYPIVCTVCEDRMCGKIVSCVQCREVYHPWCVETVQRGGKLRSHPLHPVHKLRFRVVSGSKCLVCKLNITKYGYTCHICRVSFHFKCIKAVGISAHTKYHNHYLYNFWEEDSTRMCSVCARHCAASFYGCIKCNFSAHVECLGFPTNVKNERHKHTVELTYSSEGKSCSLCGLECSDRIYSCGHCKEPFHLQCIMSTDDREAATEEDQVRDIYLMYIEQDLLKNYPSWW